MPKPSADEISIPCRQCGLELAIGVRGGLVFWRCPAGHELLTQTRVLAPDRDPATTNPQPSSQRTLNRLPKEPSTLNSPGDSMQTATQPRRTKRPAAANGKAGTNGKTTADDLVAFHVKKKLETVRIPLDKLDASPYNPRQNYPEEEIAELATLLEAHGQLVPALARPSPAVHKGLGRYELICGERRMRAARKLGWKELRADVGDFNDAETRRIVMVEAVGRRDLTEPELGLGFQRMLDAGDASSVAELVELTKLSQGYISNCLRTARLPDVILKKVISREMPGYVAREFVAIAEAPEVCKRALELAERWLPKGQAIGPEDARESIDTALHDLAGDMDQTRYIGNRQQKSYQPTEEDLTELRVITVDERRYALNKQLWKKLNDAHFERIQKQAAEKGDRADAKAAAKKKAATKKPLTEAQRKKLAEDEKRKAAERARRQADQLYHLAIDFRRYAIARALRLREEDEAAAARILLAAAGWPIRYSAGSATAVLSDATERLLRIDLGRSARDVWKGVSTLADADFWPLLTAAVAALFWEKDEEPDEPGGPVMVCPDDEVLAIADWLKLDLAGLWEDEQLGPGLSEQLWQVYNTDQLAEYCTKHKVACGGKKKSDLVAGCLQRIPPEDADASTKATTALPFPKEIAKPKRPK